MSRKGKAWGSLHANQLNMPLLLSSKAEFKRELARLQPENVKVCRDNSGANPPWRV